MSARANPQIQNFPSQFSSDFWGYVGLPPREAPFCHLANLSRPPPESRSHLDSSHLDLGISLHSSDQVFGYHNAWETEKPQNQNSETFFRKMKSKNKKIKKKKS